MSGDKKEPITMDKPAESDPTADELVVIGLHQEIAGLKQHIIELEYQVGGMSDMARMNCATHLMGAFIARGEKLYSAKEKAIREADHLIGRYQDIIEKNAVEYQKKLANIREPAENDDDTVQ